MPPDVQVKATLTLAELRKQYGPFDLIKIDAEGMEYAILQDDREFVAAGTSLIWVECNEEISSLDCADLLLELGLKLHYFAFPAHNFKNYHSQTEPLLPWAYEAGLLASRHQTIPELDELLARDLCFLKKITNREDLRRALWETPRWTPPEWPMTSSSIQLAALASRQIRSQSYESFLEKKKAPDSVAPERDYSEAQKLKNRLDTAEEALEFARTLALERLDHLQKAEIHTQHLDAALNEAKEMLKNSREAEAHIRKQLKQTQDGLDQAQKLAYERLSALDLAEVSREKFIQTEIALRRRLEQTENDLAEAQNPAFEHMEALKSSDVNLDSGFLL